MRLKRNIKAICLAIAIATFFSASNVSHATEGGFEYEKDDKSACTIKAEYSDYITPQSGDIFVITYKIYDGINEYRQGKTRVVFF